MANPENIRETQDRHSFGENATWSVVTASGNDPRDWLKSARMCSALSSFNILHAGHVSSRGGLDIYRGNQSGSFIMLTLSGEGEVLIDGNWRAIEPGQVVLLPPFIPNLFRSGKNAWEFCWVRYWAAPGKQPVVSTESPVCQPAPDHALLHAINGLYQASSDDKDLAAQQLWVSLIHHYVECYTKPANRDERLWGMWEAVQQNIAYPWTLNELAGLAHISTEHLRRLCHQQLGRSPMQHLIFLRMRAAHHMLATTSDKIESIGRAVGYTQPFTFSNTFTKWMGCRPSRVRTSSVKNQ